jgi:hypothetical protein
MGHENGGWMNDDQREHSRWLSQQAAKVYECKDCNVKSYPSVERGEVLCSNCGSNHIVCLEPVKAVAGHGPTYTDKRSFETILRWCETDLETSPSQCLCEIEQICRRQLGLQPLKFSEPIIEPEVPRLPTDLGGVPSPQTD